MPRLAAQVTTNATTEIELSAKLRTTVKAKLANIATIREQIRRLTNDLEDAKAGLEMAFHNADATDALTNGVKVGDVTVKLHTGGKTKTLNKKKLMTKFKLTPKDLASVTDEKDKKDYLGVYFPDADEDGDDE